MSESDNNAGIPNSRRKSVGMRWKSAGEILIWHRLRGDAFKRKHVAPQFRGGLSLFFEESGKVAVKIAGRARNASGVSTANGTEA
ncbi:hypothetical protein [Ruegeria sp.]|uniref:hypothetical protein n=1 Tax=Ruegeria sp. TaxID=1879320 RepID=UPI003B5CFC39